MPALNATIEIDGVHHQFHLQQMRQVSPDYFEYRVYYQKGMQGMRGSGTIAARSVLNALEKALHRIDDKINEKLPAPKEI